MQALRSNLLQRCCRDSGLSTFRAAFIHSTASSQGKWRNKWGFDAVPGKDPSKEYRKYLRRQQRSEVKKVLKGFAGMNISGKKASQNSKSSWGCYRRKNGHGGSYRKVIINFTQKSYSRNKTKKQHASSRHTAHSTEHVNANRRRRSSKKREFYWDDEDEDVDEDLYETMFRRRWCYSSFYDWDELRWESSKRYYWNTSGNYYESDDVNQFVGSASDRLALGLSPKGPLTLDEVKKAFRLAALKWHPDRNEGSTKAIAEEKFKRCGAAYKSLCEAFSVK